MRRFSQEFMKLCLYIFRLVTSFSHDKGEVIFVLDLQNLFFDVADEIVKIVLELFGQLFHSGHGDVLFVENLLDGLTQHIECFLQLHINGDTLQHLLLSLFADIETLILIISIY